MSQGSDRDRFIRFVRDVLTPYGKDYALGAVRSLAVRNMISASLPEPEEGFYPIVKVHQMALKELEDAFYDHVQQDGNEGIRENLVMEMIQRKVWE